MMVRHRGKKRKVDRKNAEQVDGELGLSTEKLQKIHDGHEMEASDKVLEIDQKHNETRKPVYEERNEIVQLIPDFWLTVFLSHPMLGERLTEEDRKIFKYLDFLDVEDSEDVKSGYSITFSFRPNPFFEDSKLTKTFTFLGEETRIAATSIKWKEGMGLPNGAAHEKKGNKRPLSGESFFHWFHDAQHKDVATQIHHEIADIIKEVWANPLTHFKKDADEAYEDMETDADEAYEDIILAQDADEAYEDIETIADITKEVWANPSTNFDGELVPSSDKLQEIPDELEKEASDKVLEIDQKHNETCKPVDAANAFLSHPMLSERLTEEDRKILEYLDTLDVEESKDVKSGYSITFNFRPNPFFEDSKLTKTFTFLEEGTIITATSIKWKEDMGLPNGAACEKKENKGPLFGESFFHWFSDAQHKDVTAQIHDEIADIIKEVWANPFTHLDEDFDEVIYIPRCADFVDPLDCRPVWGTLWPDQVSDEETEAAYMYKMDRPWLRPDQVRVEIRRGRALCVIGEGDKPLKVKLPSLNKMRVSEATASMNADHVLTIVIPKSREPSKWHEYKDLVFAWLKTVHVAVST